MQLATSSIDAKAFYESHGCNIAGKPTHSREGLEYACSCPVCGGTDRASFWPETKRFCCVRGCRAKASSPYWFLRDIKGFDHRQACQELDLDPQEVFGQNGERSPLPLFLLKDEPPCQKWQEAAAVFCRMAEKCLWSSKGETARAYLQSRGLTEATIKQARLGLCPDWYKENLEIWGLSPEQLGKEDDPQIKIPRGIVIPWYVEGNIWKIQLRRPEPGPDGKQYKEIIGSSDALYNVDSFQPGQPVLLVESELDALSAQQEAGDLVACLATGSTSKARTSRWIAKLKQASAVLQAFDDDEAGEQGAREWLHVLSNATRWTPWSHDVNDMLKENHDIKLWVETGLDIALQVELEPAEALAEVLFSLEDALQGEVSGKQEVFNELAEQIAFNLLSTEVPPALPPRVNRLTLEERIAAFQSRPCAGCGGIDWMIDVDGKLICPCIEEKRKLNKLPRPEVKPVPQHFCPHCAKAGRVSKGGVVAINNHPDPWMRKYAKTPGGRFSYVWIESQQFWMCPGCLDQQTVLSD